MNFTLLKVGLAVGITLTVGLSLSACNHGVEDEADYERVQCAEGELGEWRQLNQPEEILNLVGSGAAAVFSDGQRFTLWSGYHIATLNRDLETWEVSEVQGFPHGQGILYARGGDTLLIQGGRVDGTTTLTSAVSLLDLNELTWSTHETPAELRDWSPTGIFWTGDSYLLWGGYSSHGTPGKALARTDGLLLDPDTGSWTTFPGATDPIEYDVEELVEPANGLMTAVWTPRGLVVWGTFLESYEPVGRFYDLASGSWSVFSDGDGPTVRKYHHMVAGDDDVYLMGGVKRGSKPSANTEVMRELWRYSFSEASWEQIDLPATVEPTYGLFHNGKLYIFGSCASDAVYDPVTREFELLSPLHESGGKPFLTDGGIVWALSMEHAGAYQPYVHVFPIVD